MYECWVCDVRFLSLEVNLNYCCPFLLLQSVCLSVQLLSFYTCINTLNKALPVQGCSESELCCSALWCFEIAQTASSLLHFTIWYLLLQDSEEQHRGTSVFLRKEQENNPPFEDDKSKLQVIKMAFNGFSRVLDIVNPTLNAVIASALDQLQNVKECSRIQGLLCFKWQN